MAALHRGRAGEHPRGLVLELALLPQRPRGVEELLHLRAHVAEAGRRAPRDAVRPAQVVQRRFGDVLLGLLRLVERVDPREARPCLGELGNPAQSHLGALDGLRTFLDGARQAVHVAVGAVKDDERVGQHDRAPCSGRAAAAARRPVIQRTTAGPGIQ